MFSVRYKIVENEPYLGEVSPEKFEQDIYDVKGLIELDFDGHKIGFINPEDVSITRDNVEAFQQDLLVFWFSHLLNILDYIEQGSSFLIVTVLEEANSFLEINRDTDTLSIKKFIVNLKDLEPSLSYSIPFIANRTLDYYVYGEQLTKQEPIQLSYEWETKNIGLFELKEEILIKAREFLLEIKSRFPNLYKSSTINELREKYSTISKTTV